jgi:hypothetical protein
VFIGTRKLPKIQHNKSKSNHYDIPKVYNDNDLLNRQSLISDKNIISGLSVQQKPNNLIDDIHFDGVENTNICKKNNDNTGNKLLKNDKVSAYSYTCLCLFFLLLFIRVCVV